MNPKTILVSLFIFLSIIENIQAQDWQLAKEKNEITVYTRESENSPVKEFKASVIIESNIHDILRTILDYSNYPKWYDHCNKGEIVKRNTDGSLIHYLEFSMPFPFSNRDMVNRTHVEEKGNSIEIIISREPTAVKSQNGLVRMPVSNGLWKLVKISDTSTKVEHQFMGDPGGSIPSGIVNIFIVGGPINTLTQLEDYLRKENSSRL